MQRNRSIDVRRLDLACERLAILLESFPRDPEKAMRAAKGIEASCRCLRSSMQRKQRQISAN